MEKAPSNKNNQHKFSEVVHIFTEKVTKEHAFKVIINLNFSYLTSYNNSL